MMFLGWSTRQIEVDLLSAADTVIGCSWFSDEVGTDSGRTRTSEKLPHIFDNTLIDKPKTRTPKEYVSLILDLEETAMGFL